MTEVSGQWKDSWEKLLAGNQRFSEGKPNPNAVSAQELESLLQGQSPFAVVVTCSDSRVDPAIIFDARLGQIFVVRTAGNVLDKVELGSIEYAVEHLHVPLVVILGHSSCGAVNATCDCKDGHAESKNLEKIIRLILPSAKRSDCDKTKTVIANAKKMAKTCVRKSSVLQREVSEGKIRVVPALYDLKTGKVSSLEKKL